MQIGSSNDAAAVKEQYKTSAGLDTRISFHDKYSTNKLGYGNWIFSNFDFSKGMKVLEIGCGTGSLWIGHDDIIAELDSLVLTDLLQGMLETAEANLGKSSNVKYQLADIQDLPFEDGSFDIIIANSMLYHVPNLGKGLSEVRRVLKGDGRFYCATLGKNNFMEEIAKWFKLGGESFTPNYNFTMQNGKSKLQSAFSDIEARLYDDSLHITDIDDLVTYLSSLSSLKMLNEVPLEKIREIIKYHAIDGVVDLPKEYGMFIAS